MNQSSEHGRRPFLSSKRLNFSEVVLMAFLAIFAVEPSYRLSEAAEAQREGTSSGTGGADFGQSEMIGPTQKLREGDTIDYQIVLSNTGSERPEWVEVWNAVDSPGAMLASAPELSYDVEHRVLYWHGTVDPGEERCFALSLVTLPGSAGTIVANHASINWEGKTKSVQSDIEVRSRQRNTAILFTVGRIGLGWLEVAILGYLVFASLFVIAVPFLIRWRKRQQFERSPDVEWDDDKFAPLMVFGMSIVFVACLAVILVFGSVVFEDLRVFTSYERTTCAVLDKRLGSSMGSTGSLKGPIFGPLVSVRYAARGKEIVSAGPPARNAALSNKLRSAEKRLARYELAKSYPCWFDPEDPLEFVLTRSPSWDWYLLLLVPLIPFLISGCYLYRKLRGPDVKAEISNTPIQ